MRNTLVARQRKHLLQLDLAWFGVTELDDQRPILPDMNNLPSLMGIMYVMEGSTLGGQLIAKHIEVSLHLSPGQGDSYFRGHGDRTGTMWKEFCQLMKTRVPEDQTDAVVIAAKAMFTIFGQWMRGKIGHGCT